MFPAQATFHYAILDDAEAQLLGCVYIDPPDESAPAGSDAVVSWWVVDEAVGSELERVLVDFLPRWLADAWGFRAVRYAP